MTSESNIPALHRLVTIERIAAAFVFNSKGDILAREVPARYRDEGLKQVAGRIFELNAQIRSLGTTTQELRLNFENYGIWIRCFMKNLDYYLVLFLEKGADFSILQQPINLAVLNLEKVIQNIEAELAQEASQSDIVKAAHEAEKSLYSGNGEDTNGIYAKLCLIAHYLLGPIGEDLLLSGCRELDLRLPITRLGDVQSLVRLCADEIVDPKRKAHFLEQTGDFTQRLLVEKKLTS